MDYKEKLRLATEALNSGSYDKETIEYIFSELKESEDDKIRKALIWHLTKIDNETPLGAYHRINGIEIRDMIAWLEKRGEQKPTDKVEPKFKVGDWVVRNGNTLQIAHIDGVLDGTFHYWFTKGTWLSSIKMEDAHIWTIQDAKDGDVLVNGSNIFIFHFLNNTRLMGYCHINTDDGRFYDDLGKIECFCLIDAVVTPATKEQRDKLEKAMADAGYTFDFEKKKLEKIEQKSFARYKVGDTIYYDSFGRLVSFVIANIVEDGTDNPMYEDKDGNSVFQNDIIEQNPAWSEEDEKMYTATIFALAGFMGNEDKLDWLKSLKDRVLPQPKQEWSEEDLMAREEIINILQKCGMKKEENWLKSLRPQNTWRPDELQLECLSDAISNYNKRGYEAPILKELLEQLKKLREE